MRPPHRTRVSRSDIRAAAGRPARSARTPLTGSRRTWCNPRRARKAGRTRARRSSRWTTTPRLQEERVQGQYERPDQRTPQSPVKRRVQAELLEPDGLHNRYPTICREKDDPKSVANQFPAMSASGAERPGWRLPSHARVLPPCGRENDHVDETEGILGPSQRPWVQPAAHEPPMPAHPQGKPDQQVRDNRHDDAPERVIAHHTHQRDRTRPQHDPHDHPGRAAGRHQPDRRGRIRSPQRCRRTIQACTTPSAFS